MLTNNASLFGLRDVIPDGKLMRQLLSVHGDEHIAPAQSITLDG